MIAAALRRIFPVPCAVAWRAAGDTAPAPLFPEEEAAVRQAVAGRRREFAAGRAAARAALQELGLAAAAIVSGPDRAPEWPAGAVGSIAHSQGAAVAVAGRTGEIVALGVDLERTGAVEERLWPQVLGPAETAWLAQQPAAERARRATAIFCAKEAFYKFQYPLRRAWLDFTAVAVVLEVETETFRLESTVPLPVDSTPMYSFSGGFAIGDTFTLAGLHLRVPFRQIPGAAGKKVLL